MEYFGSAIQVMYPIFIYMGLGFLLKKWKWIDYKTVSKLNKLMFRLFLPIKLLLEILQSDFSTAFDQKLILFLVLAILVWVVILSVIIPIFIKTENISVVIQGIFRSNYVLFGMAVVANLYPGQNLGVVSVISAFVVPLYNVLAVVIFAVFGKVKISPQLLLKQIVTNNLVVAGVLGIILSLFQIQPTGVWIQPFEALGNCAAPLALICIGTTISMRNLTKYKKELAVILTGRLVILPFIMVMIAILLGVRNMELAAVCIVFGAPIAASSYPMASEMGGNGELAGIAVAVSSVFSLFTMFILIYVLKLNGVL